MIDVLHQTSKNLFSSRFVPIKNLREPSHLQKLRLQELMSGLKHHPELDSVKVKNSQKYKPRKSHIAYDPMKTCESRDELKLSYCFDQMFFNLVMQEIYERADWLAEMEELGEAKPHRQIIHFQIAERFVASYLLHLLALCFNLLKKIRLSETLK